MKKIIIVLIIVSIGTIALNAQNYKTGFGIRLGYPYGINMKHFVSKTTALDATLISTGGNIGIVALIDWHGEIEGNKNWKWYWGPVAHLMFDFIPDDYGNDVLIGLNAVVGAEYKLRNTPISLSLDWVPSLNIIGEFGLDLFNAGLSIRYVF